MFVLQISLLPDNIETNSVSADSPPPTQALPDGTGRSSAPSEFMNQLMKNRTCNFPSSIHFTFNLSSLYFACYIYTISHHLPEHLPEHLAGGVLGELL